MTMDWVGSILQYYSVIWREDVLGLNPEDCGRGL